MSNGEVRRSWSASFFSSFKTTDDQNVKEKKRLRHRKDPPAILVNENSTSTLVEKPIDINENLLAPTMQSTKHDIQQVIRLNWLKDK